MPPRRQLFLCWRLHFHPLDVVVRIGQTPLVIICGTDLAAEDYLVAAVRMIRWDNCWLLSIRWRTSSAIAAFLNGEAADLAAAESNALATALNCANKLQ